MPINQEDLWVSYLFCFLFLFVDFVGITALEASVFPQRRWWICFFVLCHINCMEILTAIIYFFHLKHGTFYTKILAFFYSIFIATNIANKPLSDCITSLKTILLFLLSPKPTAEGETKRQQSKQLQFHKINTKKKEHMSHSYYLTPIEPSFQYLSIRPWSKLSNLSAPHWTLPIPKTRKRLKCIHSQINSSKHIKINWFSDCKWSQHYSKFPSTIPHLRE